MNEQELDQVHLRKTRYFNTSVILPHDPRAQLVAMTCLADGCHCRSCCCSLSVSVRSSSNWSIHKLNLATRLTRLTRL